jgi:hypothetical protein
MVLSLPLHQGFPDLSNQVGRMLTVKNVKVVLGRVFHLKLCRVSAMGSFSALNSMTQSHAHV